MRGTVPNGVVCPCGEIRLICPPTFAPKASASRAPIATLPLPGVTLAMLPATTLSWITALRRMSSGSIPRTSTPSTRPS